MNYLYLSNLSHSNVSRKQQIKNLFNLNKDGVIAINNKWQIQLKNDKDLQKLIKENFLKTKRIPKFLSKKGGWKKSGKNQTILVLNKD